MRTPEFVTEAEGVYVLYLQVQPGKMEFQRKECLLDLEWSQPDRCKGIPSVVDLSWTLSHGGRVVADDRTEETWRAGSYSNEYIRREIGRFKAKHNERYTIEIYFRRDPSALNTANPSIVAESLQDWEAFAVETFFSYFLGSLLACVGLLLLAPFKMPGEGWKPPKSGW